MRHRVHTFKVGRSSAHRRAMLANMVSSLFTNGQIQTTLVKAKEARRFAEKLITIGKKGDLHRRRIAVAKLRDKDAVKLLFDEIAPSYEGRNGRLYPDSEARRASRRCDRNVPPSAGRKGRSEGREGRKEGNRQEGARSPRRPKPNSKKSRRKPSRPKRPRRKS